MGNQKLFQKDFTLVTIGQIISLFGNAILRFALPLYLLRATGSSALFGAVTACSFIPLILLSMVGGIVADRFNKRNIMVILDFSTAIIILVFYFTLGKLPIVPLFIAVLMILYGISGAYQPAVQASIPLLVSGEKLMVGNAVINQVNTLSGLLGPVLGGLLFGLWGITPILIISILCFAISAIMELFIRIPHEKQATGQSILGTAAADVRDSYLFIKNEMPVFFSVAYILAAFNLVLSAVMIVGIPILIIQVLGLSDESLGFTQGALALGGLAGGILTAFISKKLKLQNAHLLLTICSITALLMGVPLLLDVPPAIAYLIITIAGFIAIAASTLFTVQMFTLVQQKTPPHMVGKVMAALISIAMCAQPLGQALYGVLFDSFAPGIVLLGATTAALLISLYSRSTFRKL